MGTRILEKYDFDTTFKFLSELGEEIAEKSDGRIRIVSLVVDSEEEEMSCGSTLPKVKLFSTLLLALLAIMPKGIEKAPKGTSSFDIAKGILERMKDSE